MKITRYIHVVQRKDRTLLTFRRGFESSLGYRHTALVVKLADTSDLGSEGSGFESLLGHKMLTRRCHLTVRIPDFHSGDPGSNPGGGANGEVADEVIAQV